MEVQVNLFFLQPKKTRGGAEVERRLFLSCAQGGAEVERRLFLSCAQGGTEWSDGLLSGTGRSISCLGGWVGHTDSLDGLLKNHLCLET